MIYDSSSQNQTKYFYFILLLFCWILFRIIYKMSHYTVIRPKQNHIIKTNTRQVSLKVKPNTQMVSKEIHQPRATVTKSEYNQLHMQEQKSAFASNNADQISHIISPSSRKIRGFKVQCVNGKIVNQSTNKIPVNQQIKNKNQNVPQLRLQAQAYNSFQPKIHQRQSDQFMFSLEPYPNQKQVISPVFSQNNAPNTIPVSQSNPSNIQYQKEKTIIESVISHKQINQRGFIEIEESRQQEIKVIEDKQVVSKQIKRYQIEEKYVENPSNVQSLKSPQKDKPRHPIFTNQNAEYFEQSGVQPNSVHQHTQNISSGHKYTPINNIQSPKPHFNAFQPSYNGVQSKYQDRSFYLNNQNQL